MSTNTTAPLGRQEAERMIARILQQLETASGELIESVSLNRKDVTGIDDVRPRHRVAVEIEFYRLPGNDWSTE